jgi:uncharacterized membrane protein YuzA (DUF378 family)
MEDERSIAIVCVTALVIIGAYGVGAVGVFLVWNYAIEPWIGKRKHNRRR